MPCLLRCNCVNVGAKPSCQLLCLSHKSVCPRCHEVLVLNPQIMEIIFLLKCYTRLHLRVRYNQNPQNAVLKTLQNPHTSVCRVEVIRPKSTFCPISTNACLTACTKKVSQKLNPSFKPPAAPLI